MLHISSCQYSSLNNTLTNDCPKRTSFLRFGKKVLFCCCMNYCYFSHDLYVALFFHLLTSFTKIYQSLCVMGKTQQTTANAPALLIFLSIFFFFFGDVINILVTSKRSMKKECTKIFKVQGFQGFIELLAPGG